MMGMQRTLEDCQFDPENARTTSHLNRKSTEGIHAAPLIIEILKRSDGKTVDECCGSSSKQMVESVVRSVGSKHRWTCKSNCTVTRNGAWARTRLRERFGANTGATCFNELFQYGWPKDKPFEDVWRDLVKKSLDIAH